MNWSVFWWSDVLEHHSKQLLRNSFFQLRKISKLRTMASKDEFEMTIHDFVSWWSDYCNSLFTCWTLKKLACLQVIQNSAARPLTCTNRRVHITPGLKFLHWLPVNYWIHFRFWSWLSEPYMGRLYIAYLIQPYSSSRSPRSSDKNLQMVYGLKETDLFKQLRLDSGTNPLSSYVHWILPILSIGILKQSYSLKHFS